MNNLQLAQQELDEIMSAYQAANPDGGVYGERELLASDVALKFNLSPEDERRLLF